MNKDYLSDEDFNETPQGKDFLEEESPLSKESYFTSAWKAVPRMGIDAWHQAIETARNIPKYLQTGKSELRGLPQTIKEHPGHAISQLGAGITEMGHNILNTPASLVDYGVNRLHLLPESASKNIIRQPDISQQINEAFGEAKYPGESLLRGISRNLVPELAGAKALSITNPLNYTNKAITKDILKTGQKNQSFYSKKYNQLFDNAEKQGFDDALNNVDMDMKTLKKYTPKTKIVGVENFNENPTLQNAHKAKSDLLKLERKYGEKDFLNEGEKEHLTAISDAIGSLQENMFKDANGKINPRYMDQYNQLQRGYAMDVVPYKNKYINKYKRQEINEKQLVEALKNGSFGIKRGANHPELMNQDLMKKTLIAAGLVGGGALGTRSLYNRANNELMNP